jgi:hypothetical protein
MPPITTNGNAPRLAMVRYSSGTSACVSATTPAATRKLIHQGERSRTANSEFCAMRGNFMRA